MFVRRIVKGVKEMNCNGELFLIFCGIKREKDRNRIGFIRSFVFFIHSGFYQNLCYSKNQGLFSYSIVLIFLL